MNLSIFRSRWFFVFLLALVVTVCFWPTLQNEFVNLDDDTHLYENLTIRQLDFDHLAQIFTSKVNKLYIPLTSLSFAIEYHFFKLDPFIYHLNNLLLHLFVVAIIYLWALKLGLSRSAAFIGALLFGIHPMRVESVAWVTERKDVLYAAFYMSSVYCYWKFLELSKIEGEGKKVVYFDISVILGVLSLLAKPMALSLPLIFLLSDWFSSRKFSKKWIWEKIPLCVIFVVITWLSYSAHARFPIGKISDGILIWLWSFTFYLKQFLLPFYLAPVYSLPQPIALSNFEYSLSLVFFVFLLLALFRFRKHRWFIFAFLFYFLSIFFLLRFDSGLDANVVADRFMYLPSTALCLFIAIFVERSWMFFNQKVKSSGAVIVILATMILATLGWKTYQQSGVWKSSITLWEHQISLYPDQALAFNNLANAISDEDDYKEAEEKYRLLMNMINDGVDAQSLNFKNEHVLKVDKVISLYKTAIQLKPSYAAAYYNLGKIYQDVGRSKDALAAFLKTISIDPRYKDAHYSLGQLYQENGQPKKAAGAYMFILKHNAGDEDVYVNIIQAFTEAINKYPTEMVYVEQRLAALKKYEQFIEKKPDKGDSYFHLANLLSEMGMYNESINYYKRSLDLKPNNINALYNIANTYEEIGEDDLAVTVYNKLIKKEPKFADAYLNLGVIYTKMGQIRQAKDYYHKAIKYNKKNANAYFNLAFISESAGNYTEAISLYKKAIKFDSKHSEAYYNLGNVYANIGNNRKAIESYVKTVHIDSNHEDALVNLSILSFREKDFKMAVHYLDEARILGYQPPPKYLQMLETYR